VNRRGGSVGSRELARRALLSGLDRAADIEPIVPLLKLDVCLIRDGKETRLHPRSTRRIALKQPAREGANGPALSPDKFRRRAAS